MNAFIKRLIIHPLISGSTIILIGSFGANILNYLFNLGMGRLLSVNDYRIMVSLIAIISLLTIFQTALTNLFTKFAARYVHNDPGAQGLLVWSGTKITLGISVIFLLVLLVFLNPIASYMHVSNVVLMVLIFLSVAFSIMYSLPLGIMQGNLRFAWISVSNIFGSLVKFAVGIGLVIYGWGLIGAGIGVLFAFIVPYVFSMAYVLTKFKSQKKSSDIHVHFFQEFKKVSGAFLLASVAITILQGTDVIFASHYLPNLAAGQFAALSLMGKAIFYITSPIYFAFFPIIAHKKEKKEKTTGTLFLASGIIFLCSIFLTLIYFTFPHIVLKIFFPAPAYQSLAPYLGFYSIYIMIFSFCFLLYNYFLSVGKLSVYKLIWLVTGVYFLMIYFFHSSIQAFVAVQIATSFLLLVSLLVYYMKNEGD